VSRILEATRAARDNGHLVVHPTLFILPVDETVRAMSIPAPKLDRAARQPPQIALDPSPQAGSCRSPAPPNCTRDVVVKKMSVVPEFRPHREHVGHEHGARRLFQPLPSAKSQRRVWRGSEPQIGRGGKGKKAENNLVIYLMICQRFLDLRGEESLRMRAAAKPIITSTRPITSTGRDYLRVQRTPTRNLHNRNEFCTGRRGVQT